MAPGLSGTREGSPASHGHHAHPPHTLLLRCRLAGSGIDGHADGHAVAAHFSQPFGITVDGDGNAIVSEQSGHRIRKITPDGTVTTLAGSGSGGFADGSGTGAHFRHPRGVAIDADGRVVVADYSNSRVRRFDSQLSPPRPLSLPAALPSAYEAQMRAMLHDSAFADVTFEVGPHQSTPIWGSHTERLAD